MAPSIRRRASRFVRVVAAYAAIACSTEQIAPGPSTAPWEWGASFAEAQLLYGPMEPCAGDDGAAPADETWLCTSKLFHGFPAGEMFLFEKGRLASVNVVVENPADDDVDQLVSALVAELGPPSDDETADFPANERLIAWATTTMTIRRPVTQQGGRFTVGDPILAIRYQSPQAVPQQ